jgi:uncharacterized protein with HEPN domain
MSDIELIGEILAQITEASQRIERRFLSITGPDDFLNSEDGVDRLDAICMMLIAIGESLKNLDKVTGGHLLSKYPEIDWKGAKGIRDIISHHYFDLNADIVFAVCKDRLPGLMRVISEMKNSKDGRPS